MVRRSRPSGYYTEVEACSKLGIWKKYLVKCRNDGWLPYIKEARNHYYDCDHIDRLANLIRITVSHGGRRQDPALMKLCYLQYLYKSCPSDVSSRQRANYAAAIVKRCAALVASGKIVPFEKLSNALTNFYGKPSMEKWAAEGRVASVRIGRTHYLSTAYYQKLVALFENRLTLVQACERLGLHYSTLASRIAARSVDGLRGPDGILRISHSSLEVLRHTRDASPDNFTFREAAAILGLRQPVLRSRVYEGKVASTGSGRARRIPRAEVEHWQTKFASLNPGFEWLQAQIVFSGRTVKTLSADQARKRLGIVSSTMTLWSQDNLLPYYVRSFGTGDGSKDTRLFVELYIYGLTRFAYEGKVTKKHARRYIQLCIKAEAIV